MVLVIIAKRRPCPPSSWSKVWTLFLLMLLLDAATVCTCHTHPHPRATTTTSSSSSTHIDTTIATAAVVVIHSNIPFLSLVHAVVVFSLLKCCRRWGGAGRKRSVNWPNPKGVDLVSSSAGRCGRWCRIESRGRRGGWWEGIEWVHGPFEGRIIRFCCSPSFYCPCCCWCCGRHSFGVVCCHCHC